MQTATHEVLAAGFLAKSGEDIPQASPRGRGHLFVVVGMLLTLSAHEAQSQVKYESGVASFPGSPTIVNLDSLPPASSLPLLERTVRTHPPLRGLTEDEYRAIKQRAAIPALIHPERAPLPSPEKAATAPALAAGPYVSFDGNKRSACRQVFPADMALAVGDDTSTHSVMQVNNACINLFTKDGRPRDKYPKALAGLFGSDPFDPRALYDWANRRYIIVATNREGEYLLAVSKQNNSSGDYYVYKIPLPSGAHNAFADFPRLGQDRDKIYIASNKIVDGKFQYEEWLVLPKSKLYEGRGAFDYGFLYDTRFDGIATSSSQPANVWNPADQMRGVFVGSKALKAGGGLWCKDASEKCNELFLWHVVDGSTKMPWPLAGAVVLRTAHIYSIPPDASQPEPKWPIWTGQTDIVGQVTYSAYSLFAALHTRNNAGGASALLVRIGELYPSGGIEHARITDEALLDYGKESAIYATPLPDLKGNTVTAFGLSGPNYNPSAALILRRNGQFVQPTLVPRRGLATYKSPRWGDYTAVAPGLPEQAGGPSLMWFAGMYSAAGLVNGAPEWLTVVGNADSWPAQAP